MYFDRSQRPAQFGNPRVTYTGEPQNDAGGMGGGFRGNIGARLSGPVPQTGGQMPAQPYAPPPTGGPAQQIPQDATSVGAYGNPGMHTGGQLPAQSWQSQFQSQVHPAFQPNPNTGIVPPNMQPGANWQDALRTAYMTQFPQQFRGRY